MSNTVPFTDRLGDYLKNNKHMLVILLSIQNAGAVLLMRYTRSFPGQNLFHPQVAVISQEAIKGLTCFYILFRKKEVSESYSNLVETLKVAVPALLYLYQNNAQYYASGNLNAATYTISYQSKTIWAALLSIVILGRWMILRKWIALFILAIGIIQVQLSGILEVKWPNCKHSKR